MKSDSSLQVVWSAIHTGPFDERYFHDVIERASKHHVDGVELSGRNVTAASGYRDFPALAATVSQNAVAERLAAIQRLSKHAADCGMRFGLWHHEIHGPDDWLEHMPELRAPDGLIDLDNPLLYQFITTKIRVFLEACPHVDEIVLTMTETLYPVFRRPFCTIPVPERVLRILKAVTAATEPLGRRLVIRPFSAIREDELHVREAVEKLDAENVSLMYKTEPFDWHPCIPNEPLIGSVKKYEARGETDAGAEYYGQGMFPCSYIRHLEHRLRPAVEKGAGAIIIRVDRGASCPALGHPINEGNVIAPTLWAKSPGRDFRVCWEDWFRRRHDADPTGWFDLFESTFEVIRKSLYVDGQAYTHHKFPSLWHIKHVQGFGLLEEEIPLAHMARNWGILSERKTLTHEAILEEKEQALALAETILSDFDARAATLPPSAQQAIRPLLLRLPLLAEACLRLFRVSIAHVEEMWKRCVRSTRSFREETADLRNLADRIDHDLGPDFWGDMASRLREVADSLEQERAMEIPLRAQIENRAGLVDYVLCGFASEGHRLEKMLHSGGSPQMAGRMVRKTGIGPEQGFGYTMRKNADRPHRLVVTFIGTNTKKILAGIRIGDHEQNIEISVFEGIRDVTIEVPPTPGTELSISIWSKTTEACSVASFVLLDA